MDQQQDIAYMVGLIVGTKKMTQKVEGFLTSSGAFYRSEVEANFHEARENMANTLSEHNYSVDLLTVLDKFSIPIALYLSAKIELDQTRKAEEINAGIQGVRNTREMRPAVEDTLHVDSSGNVSDMGSDAVRVEEDLQSNEQVAST